MSRFVFLCLILFVSCFSLGQNNKTRTAATTPTGVQVLYVVEDTTIYTYNVVPQTLNLNQVGTPLDITNANLGYEEYLASTPNDHFIYFLAANAQETPYLWVFATDTNGAPLAPAVQQMAVPGLLGIQVNPQGNFLYAIIAGVSKNLVTPTTIQRYAIDPTTGEITQPVVEATYQVQTNSSGEYCDLQLLSFNKAGTKLYDEVSCDGGGEGKGTYFELPVNPQTGVLGSETQLFHWSNATEGMDFVQFTAGLMFDFKNPASYMTGYNSVNVYSVTGDVKSLLVHCAESMLEACGSSLGVAHPSGEYVFMAIAQDTTQIDRVDLTDKKIVDTGNYIPGGLVYGLTSEFSPDGTLVYATSQSNGSFSIQVFGFNVATSAVTPGEMIGHSGPFYTAERY
jgi:hypothetical protein